MSCDHTDLTMAVAAISVAIVRRLQHSTVISSPFAMSCHLLCVKKLAMKAQNGNHMTIPCCNTVTESWLPRAQIKSHAYGDIAMVEIMRMCPKSPHSALSKLQTVVK